jgi:hypothetical protein
MSNESTGARTAPSSVEGVIAAMRSLDGTLPINDGLKWFNLLYLTVSESVQQNLHLRQWSNPTWLQRLDVVFANLYFDAIAKWGVDTAQTPHAWRALFESRQNPRLVRVQFALAGMNAHINRDLCVALIRMAEADGSFPSRTSGIHDDYVAVNGILEQAEQKAVAFLSTGIVGMIDQALGDVDNVLAMWNVRKAREAAWVNAEVLWHLRPFPWLADDYLVRLDRLAGFAGKGLLQPIFSKR